MVSNEQESGGFGGTGVRHFGNGRPGKDFFVHAHRFASVLRIAGVEGKDFGEDEEDDCGGDCSVEALWPSMVLLEMVVGDRTGQDKAGQGRN